MAFANVLATRAAAALGLVLLYRTTRILNFAHGDIGVAATFAMAAGTAITVAAVAVLAVGAKGLATRLASGGNRTGTVIFRSLEFVAALAIVAVGVLLFTGMLASERMFPV